MKKERFKNIGTDIFQYGEWWCSASGEHCADVIATAMNELIEENEQLKSDVYDWKVSAKDYLKLGKSLKKENEQLKSDNHLLYSRNTDLKRKNELYDAENEQLKQEIENLQEQLAHIGDVFE